MSSGPRPPSIAVGPGSSNDDIIRAWTEAIRERDWNTATDLFAVPAVVQNGPEKLTLTEPAQVYGFNSSLPCGARLIRTDVKGRYTVATFLLLQRRSGSCGDGAGRRAATAFRFEKGKIVEWLRVPIPPEANQPPNPNAPSV